VRHTSKIRADGTHRQELRPCVVRQVFEQMLLPSLCSLLRTMTGTVFRNTIDIEIRRSFGATDAIGSDHLVSLFLLVLWSDK
jgi:hypothetical protein